MAKGKTLRTLLKELNEQAINLEGPGVQGTGREVVPAQQEIDALVEKYGINPEEFAGPTQTPGLPPVSRRNFLKGIGAAAMPSPLSMLSELPTGAVGKMAEEAAVLPTGKITIGKSVGTLLEDMYDITRQNITEEAASIGNDISHDMLDWYASKEGLEDEVFEIGKDWNTWKHHQTGESDPTLHAQDEVSAMLYDAGMSQKEADELASQIVSTGEPTFENFDSDNPSQAAAYFNVDIQAPSDVLKKIEMAQKGYQFIDIEDLKYLEDPNVPLNKLAKEDAPYIASLRRQIESDGLQKPLVVLQQEGRPDMLWDGSHRLIALEDMGETQVPVRFISSPDEKALGGLVQKYAKGGTVATIVNRDLQELRQFAQGQTVQPGVFSTLDEAIKDAPFDVNSGDQWLKYLTPGRMVKREGIQFPLKKEELQYAGGLENYLKGPDKLTKQEVRDLITTNRQPFALTTAQDTMDEFGDESVTRFEGLPPRWNEMFNKYGADITDIPTANEARVIREQAETSLSPGFTRYGPSYGGGERLFHASPGSTYEESVTRMPYADYPSHFTPDTVSWSRTSTHNTEPLSRTSTGEMEPLAGNQRVRLVEEIQSDLHSAAADKYYIHKPSGQPISELQYELNKKRHGNLFEESNYEVHRMGYADRDAEDALREIDDRLEELSGELQGRDYDEDPEVVRLENSRRQYENRPSDVPYKDPKDYAALELRKQLLNAVENDEDYLAIVRGADQVERYKQGMDERRQGGMEYFYDKLYPAELKKLAKRYGATVEDVRVPLRQAPDLRPPNMVEFGSEDFVDYTDSLVEHLKGLESGPDVNIALGSLEEDLSFLYNRMTHDHYDSTAHLDDVRSKLVNLTNEVESVRMRADEIFDDALAESIESVRSGSIGEAEAEWQQLMNRLLVIGKESDKLLRKYSEAIREDYPTSKTFPAIKLTPEVKERIRKIGVPQYALGGLVKKYGKGGVASATLGSFIKPIDAYADSDEYERVLAEMKESDYDRETSELMGTLDYWKDAAKRVPAIMSSMWKTLNQDTGEAEWNFGHKPPPFEWVEQGIMDIDEWMKLKKAAEQASEDNPMRPGIIDDTISMAAIPYGVANMFRDEDNQLETPEAIEDAMLRSMELQGKIEQDWQLGEARGLPQHLATGLGVMLGQVPSPKSAAEVMFSGLGKLAGPVTKRLPQAVNTAGNAVMAVPKIAAEFYDPTVSPSIKNYLLGTAFGGGLGQYAENVSDEAPRSFETLEAERSIADLQQKQYFDTIRQYTTDNWEELPMETRFSMLSNPNPEVNQAIMESLTPQQIDELMRAADEAGLLEMNDAE